ALFIGAFFILAVSHARLIARDEGYYLFAADLVSQGFTPYLDFFYPQMPLLPYVYGAWYGIVGASWEAARFLSAFFTIGTMLLVYHEASLTTASRKSGATIAFLFSIFNLTYAWHPTGQTYGLSVF